MGKESAFSKTSWARGFVVALSCSGAGAGQWRGLGEMLDADYEFAAPEHYGSASGPDPYEHGRSQVGEEPMTSPRGA